MQTLSVLMDVWCSNDPEHIMESLNASLNETLLQYFWQHVQLTLVRFSFIPFRSDVKNFISSNLKL